MGIGQSLLDLVFGRSDEAHLGELSALDALDFENRPFISDFSLWEVATLTSIKRLTLDRPWTMAFNRCETGFGPNFSRCRFQWRSNWRSYRTRFIVTRPIERSLQQPEHMVYPS